MKLRITRPVRLGNLTLRRDDETDMPEAVGRDLVARGCAVELFDSPAPQGAGEARQSPRRRRNGPADAVADPPADQRE
jgi:hypothetical protein